MARYPPDTITGNNTTAEALPTAQTLADTNTTVVAPAASATQMTAGRKTLGSIIKTFADNIAYLFKRRALTQRGTASWTSLNAGWQQWVTVTMPVAMPDTNYIVNLEAVNTFVVLGVTNAGPHGAGSFQVLVSNFTAETIAAGSFRWTAFYPN